MVWSILLLLNNTNGWFINYIEKKLKSQIYKSNLQNKIEVIIFKPNVRFVGDYVNVIENETDISDNYIDIIYNKIINTKSDCVGLKGILIVNNKPYLHSNMKINDHIQIPINKSNPIKKEIVFNLKNIIYYINSKDLSKYINSIVPVDEIVVFKNEYTIKQPFSIIVTAYKTQDYIEECLDSIENQTYFIDNDKFEVLVGVDACQKTLNKLNEIKYKYRNLKIYMMEKNVGTYVTTNTLIGLLKNQNVIRFDSDDIMRPNLVSEVVNNKKDSDIVLLGSYEFQNSKINKKILLTEGTIYFKKIFMNKIAGGYKPWLCSADTELIRRVVNKAKISQIKIPLFYRRVHSESLTQKKSTAYKSEIREKYKKQIKKIYGDNDIKIRRAVIKYKEIKSDFIDIKEIIKKPISIYVTAYNTYNYIEECLDSIENQTYFINNNDFEVVVGVDACQKTLDKLKEIKHKYRNLSIYMMNRNMGTYVTSNTMLDIVKYDNIIRFDSDDIMLPDMIYNLMLMSNYHNVIRMKYNNFEFDEKNKKTLTSHVQVAAGVIFYKRKIINKVGGYKSWVCAADSELIERISKIDNIFRLNKILFHRRLHDQSLSNSEKTKMRSKIRDEYHAKILEVKRNNEIYINKEKNNFTKIKNKVKHLVVTRLAIKWRYKEANLSWEKWLDNSIYLMDNFCRPSLKNQSDQDFTLLSLVDSSVNYYGNVLNNEVILKMLNKYSELNENIVDVINKYILSLESYDSIIITRLDRDDALKFDFIGNVKKHLSNYNEQYVDINKSITYNLNDNIAHNSKKYDNTFISPFVSTYENIINNKIRCVPFLVEHTKVDKVLKGKKVNDLIAMQVIHEHNLKNKIYGKEITINKKEFGI